MSPGKDKVSSTKTHWWARWKLPTPMCTLTVAEKINHKSRKRTAAGVVNKSKPSDLRLTSSHSATSKSLLPEIYPNFSLPSNLWGWMVLGYSYPKKAFTTKHENSSLCPATMPGFTFSRSYLGRATFSLNLSWRPVKWGCSSDPQ